MVILIQIVDASKKQIPEDVSFYNDYKYWVFFGILLILFYSRRLYMHRKKVQPKKQIANLVDKTSNETISVNDSITNSTLEKKKKEKKATKFQSTKKPVIERITIKEESILLQEPIKKPIIEEKKDNINEVLGLSIIEIEEISKDDPIQNVLSLKIDQHEEDKVSICLEKDNEPPLISNYKGSRSSEIDNSIKEETESIESIEDSERSEAKKIGFTPNNNFKQDKVTKYPIIKMPLKESWVKFPRDGRSNRTGFTEDDFFNVLQGFFSKDFKIFNDKHLVPKSGKLPYEPDIILINEQESKNIFIDLEIDEPYDGYSRTPTHEHGKDIVRDNFFTDRGWLVIRFSEIQIHQKPIECCLKIAEVINSIDPDYEIPFNLLFQDEVFFDNAWSSLQAKKWIKENYRENYLGIDFFGKRPNIQYEFDLQASKIDDFIEESINDEIELPAYVGPSEALANNEHERDVRLRFDPVKHRYFIDENPDTVSVSQLIAKYFPEFDSEYWSHKKAKDRGIDVQEILQEWETKRNDAARLGTDLHEQIENYYNKLPYDDQSPEFQYFLNFKKKYSKDLDPYRSEWRVFDEDLLIAGTVDMLYKKEGDELYMFDWKRSGKVIDSLGNPKLPNYDYASGKLSHLSDNSYHKYVLQQNIYKYILEKRYNKKITSMNLLILHPDYENYHHVKLPELHDEVAYIFENAKYNR